MKNIVQRGFTLLELMIIIAIIGVLAVIALPAYQDYTIRTRVAEGMSLAGAAKTTVADNAANAASDLSQNYNGLPAAGTKNVKSISIDKVKGEINIKFPASVEADKALVLVPTSAGKALSAGTPPGGPLIWTCNGKDTTLNVKYRPTECR